MSKRLKRVGNVLMIDAGLGVGTVPAEAFDGETPEAAYRRGRREAIEEAARYLRAYSQRASSGGMPDTASLLTSAAEGIERHEELSEKGPARGQ